MLCIERFVFGPTHDTHDDAYAVPISLATSEMMASMPKSKYAEERCSAEFTDVIGLACRLWAEPLLNDSLISRPRLDTTASVAYCFSIQLAS